MNIEILIPYFNNEARERLNEIKSIKYLKM